MAEIDVTRIAGNIGAMNSLNALTNINKQLAVHQTRLATGKRINSAADDPAGLTIATKMLSRSEGLKVALGNIGDAKNLLAVAESGLGRINDILVQMRNKAEAAASDTLGVNERAAVVTQLKAYAEQIDDISEQTEWNGNKLINGSYNSTALTFQTGAGESDYTSVSGLKNMSATDADGLLLATKVTSDTAYVAPNARLTNTTVTPQGGNTLATGTYTLRLSAATNADAGSRNLALYDSTGKQVGTTVENVDIDDAGSAQNVGGLGFNIAQDAAVGDVSVGFINANETGLSYTNSGGNTVVLSGSSSATDFRGYMAYIGTKLDTVSEQLSNIGALTGRLTFKEDQVSAAQINVEAAYNRIMNANMAEEQVNSSKFQILQQTATAMLSQANAAPQFLLSLFR